MDVAKATAVFFVDPPIGIEWPPGTAYFPVMRRAKQVSVQRV
jgi:hypothetical protein